MNYKKKLYIYTGISAVGVLFGSIFMNTSMLGICPSGTSICPFRYTSVIGQPFVLFFGSLFLIFFTLLFTKEAVWNKWKKFGIWYIPLATFLIFLAPSSSGGSFGYSMGFDREGVAMFTSGLFLIISLIIITIKSYKLHQKKGLFSFFRK